MNMFLAWIIRNQHGLIVGLYSAVAVISLMSGYWILETKKSNKVYYTWLALNVMWSGLWIGLSFYKE
jgi:hypothetical protein